MQVKNLEPCVKNVITRTHTHTRAQFRILFVSLEVQLWSTAYVKSTDIKLNEEINQGTGWSGKHKQRKTNHR